MSEVGAPVRPGPLERAWGATVLAPTWYGVWLRWLLAAAAAAAAGWLWRTWLVGLIVGFAVFTYLTMQERRRKRRLAAEQAWREREAAIELQAEAVRRGVERGRLASKDEGGAP
jgi:hypothetical protein